MGLRGSIKQWFYENNLDTAVVGFSGGVDSATTAMLLKDVGINVQLVVAETKYQEYSSPMGGLEGTQRFAEQCGFSPEIRVKYPHLFHAEVENEAAAPIIRNAIFYGVAARLNALGRKACVVGTANFSEAAFLGFWGKASDAAQDFYPISHLSKSGVYALAKGLGVPDEILSAEPSGDLLFTKTNDREMIGATYDQIEEFIRSIHDGRPNFDVVEGPMKFCENIIKNEFKYKLPFPGFHLYSNLESFRVNQYPKVIAGAKVYVRHHKVLRRPSY